MGTFTEEAHVWLYPAEHAAWHFVSLSKKKTAQLRVEYKEFTRGFGSLPVEVTIGNTTWQTSVFYDGKHEQYILPLKAEVRRREDIRVDEKVRVKVSIRA